jgi:hypothetical protein
VRAEEDGPTLAQPYRLERRRSAQERLVVGEEDRRVGVDDAASGDRDGEQAQVRASAVERGGLTPGGSGARAASPSGPRRQPRR